MAPSDKEAKAHWAAYLKAKLDARGWDAVRLVAESNDELTYKSVNNWLAARAMADPEAVAVVAEVLSIDLAEVLRATNRLRLAKLFSERPRAAGAEPEPLDEGVRIILARKTLTEDQQADAIAHWNRRKARLLAEINGLLDAMLEPNGESESA